MENNPQLGLDVWALIQQGAISTYPLLACSVILLGIVLERAWSLRGIIGSTAKLTRDVVPLLARGDWQAALEIARKHRACPARRVYTDLIDGEAGVPMPELERVATERNFEEVQGAGSNLWVLGTIGAAAPFIGLFGTVMGIIRAFHAIALAGTGGFAVVAAGISEALIATAGGLLVGVLSIFAYNAFNVRINTVNAAMRDSADEILQQLGEVPAHEGSVPRVVQSR